MGKVFRKVILIFALLVAALIAVTVGAADGKVVEEPELFESAYRHYLAEHYKKAILAFEQFLEAYPESSAKDGALFWQGKSLLALGNKEEARKKFAEIINHYSDSPFGQFAGMELEGLRPESDTDIKLGDSGEKTELTGQTIQENGRENLKKLEIQQKDLEEKISRLSSRNELLEQGLAKALDDMETSDKTLATANKTIDGLNKRLAETAERQQEAASKHQLLEQRLAKALKALEEKGNSEKLLAAADKDLDDLKKRLAEADSLKSRNAELQKTGEATEARLREHERQAAALAVEHNSNANKLAAAVKAKDAAIAEAVTLKAKIAELQGTAARVTEVATETEKNRKELQVYAARLKAAEDSAKELREKNDTYRSRTDAEYKRLEGEKVAIEKRLRELADSDREIRAKASEYARPIVRIGGKAYSMLQVIEEDIIAGKVLARMNIAEVPWRRGNAYRDFIVEQALLKSIRDGGPKEDDAALNELSRRYALDDKEKGYLRKYLLLSGLMARKMADEGITEENMMNYYKAHKKEYLLKDGEKMLRSLSLVYTEANALDKISQAAEIRGEAIQGKSFEEIGTKRPGVLSFRIVRVNELTPWIGEKVKSLKDGEISNIISADNSYIFFQPFTTGQVYRDYGEVKTEIRNKLISGSSLSAWLNEIEKSAEEIR